MKVAAGALISLAAAGAALAIASADSTVGTAVAIALVGCAAVGGVALAFFAVGESEDRDRAETGEPPAPEPEPEPESDHSRPPPAADAGPRPRPPRPPTSAPPRLGGAIPAVRLERGRALLRQPLRRRRPRCCAPRCGRVRMPGMTVETSGRLST